MNTSDRIKPLSDFMQGFKDRIICLPYSLPYSRESEQLLLSICNTLSFCIVVGIISYCRCIVKRKDYKMWEKWNARDLKSRKWTLQKLKTWSKSCEHNSFSTKVIWPYDQSVIYSWSQKEFVPVQGTKSWSFIPI